MLKITDISKKIEEKQVLQNISFSLSLGDVLGLVGPNGAGKSTLLGIIGGILPQSQGQVVYIQDGREGQLPKTSIAYIPQDIVLYEDMTVYENLTAFGLGLNESANILKNKIALLAETLSIQDILQERVSSLSGGLKRRVNIAAGLTGEPLLVLMDEPVVGIDVGKTKEVENLIQRLQSKDCILILTSHTSEFLSNTCNKLLVLEDGIQTYFGNFDPLLLPKTQGDSR